MGLAYRLGSSLLVLMYSSSSLCTGALRMYPRLSLRVNIQRYLTYQLPWVCSFSSGNKYMLTTLLLSDNDHALPEVPALQDIQERLASVLQPANDVLLVLDLPASDASGERPVELVLVLRHERADEEAVERDLAPHELLEVLDGVWRFRVIPGDVATDL